MDTYEIFTDGACRGNPGLGGWGAIVRMNGTDQTLSGSERYTTNNRMELTAAIEALKMIPTASHVTLTTDSQYLRKGMTEWMMGWERRGWKTADKKPVKNIDLWQSLAELAKSHEICWNWVKGHSGHPENEQADQLANAAIDQFLQSKETAYASNHA